MAMHYTVSTAHDPHGRGYRVRCFGLPDDDWNALGHTVYEHTHDHREDAIAAAKSLMAEWSADVQGCLADYLTDD
jgi:hypothetical protein